MGGENLARFWLALQFLTRLPVRTAGIFTPERLRFTPAFYPAVGVVVGLITGLLAWGLAAIFPPVVAVLLSTLAGLMVTGALHEDGLADLCDGLGGGRSRERALEIMRDSRLGSYGVIGLGLALALKVATLAALPVWALPLVLLAGHSASRASMLAVMASSDYVRPEGAGSAVSGGISGDMLRVAALTTALALLPLLICLPFPLLGGILGLIFAHAALRQRFEARLGGYTGDCLGATQQVSEIGFYLGVLALI
jgi:adenosylcobinamide-GDP ribazoletransferase